MEIIKWKKLFALAFFSYSLSDHRVLEIEFRIANNTIIGICHHSLQASHKCLGLAIANFANKAGNIKLRWIMLLIGIKR